jgi:Phage integrase family
MPSLIFTGRYGTTIDPRTLNRKFTARCDTAAVRRLTVHDARHTCATLLVDLDVHPCVIMRILRHADQAVTMEIYANASSAATRDALRRLGDILHRLAAVLCCCTCSSTALVQNPNMHLTRHSAVGVTGFEPATSSSRTKRATKLRHTPCRTEPRRV